MPLATKTETQGARERPVPKTIMAGEPGVRVSPSRRYALQGAIGCDVCAFKSES